MRTTATTITSMRNTTVVSKAARMPTPRVRNEGRRAVPFEPRRSMNRDTTSVRNVKPHAVLGCEFHGREIGRRTDQWDG